MANVTMESDLRQPRTGAAAPTPPPAYPGVQPPPKMAAPAPTATTQPAQPKTAPAAPNFPAPTPVQPPAPVTFAGQQPAPAAQPAGLDTNAIAAYAQQQAASGVKNPWEAAVRAQLSQAAGMGGGFATTGQGGTVDGYVMQVMRELAQQHPEVANDSFFQRHTAESQAMDAQRQAFYRDAQTYGWDPAQQERMMRELGIAGRGAPTTLAEATAALQNAPLPTLRAGDPSDPSTMAILYGRNGDGDFVQNPDALRSLADGFGSGAAERIGTGQSTYQQEADAYAAAQPKNFVETVADLIRRVQAKQGASGGGAAGGGGGSGGAAGGVGALPQVPAGVGGSPPMPGGVGAAAGGGSYAALAPFGPGHDLRFTQVSPALGADNQAARKAVMDLVARVQNRPDRVKQAQDAYQLLRDQSEPEYQQDLRHVVQLAARAGRLGAGMTTSQLNDVTAQRERDLGFAARDLSLQAADQSFADDTSALGQLLGADSQLFGQDASMRGELRTERGYQADQAQQALQNRVLQTQLEESLRNGSASRSNAIMSQLLSLYGADDPMRALALLTSMQSGNASDASKAALDLISAAAKRYGSGGSSGGGTSVPEGTQVPDFGGYYG